MLKVDSWPIILYCECYVQIIQMNRNFLSGDRDHQDYIPTIQSIDAQSEFSVDLKQNDLDPLLTKIFMLCIELDRKDILLDQLQQNAQRGELRKSQIDMTHRDLSQRYEKLQSEYRSMIQNNAILKNQNLGMQKSLREMETYKNNTFFNKELEEKVRSLENRLRRTEQQKIELIEKEKNLKRELSMLSYNVIKSSEKNKIRDLEHDLVQEKSKLDAEKRVTAEQKFLLEKYSSEVKELKESENRIVRTYEQKISLIRANEDLRKSQISMETQEKVVLMSQEMNRLKEETDYLKRQLHQKSIKANEGEEQINKLIEQLKCMEQEIQKFQNSYGKIQDQFRQKEEHLLIQLENFDKQNKHLQARCAELDYYLKQRSYNDAEKSKQVQRLREEIECLENDKATQKAEIRKFKKQSFLKNGGQCEVCKVRASSTSIPSSKNLSDWLNPVDFEQLIRETQKLNQSNKKIQNLINNHEVSSQHSIQHRHSYSLVQDIHVVDMHRT